MATLGGDELPPMDPTSTNTPIPEPDMSLDSNTPSALSKLNVFVIVVPVLLATGIIIWGTLVLLGIIQRRRHLRSVSAWSSTRGGEKARVSLLKKPVLLDVRLPYTSHASSTERVHVSYIYTCLPHVADYTPAYIRRISEVFLHTKRTEGSQTPLFHSNEGKSAASEVRPCRDFFWKNIH